MSTKRYLITGVGGFVGSSIARALRANEHEVIGLARNEYPEMRALGVRTAQCDLARLSEKELPLFEGVEAIFHTAAKVEMFGKYEEFYAANVVATRKLLAAARRQGVPKFIFTSSPSVVADGSDLRGVDESYPYPPHYEAHYPATKAVAEREVCAASDVSLWTVALRPHLIWGPGDTNLVPRILARARSGRLIRVGTGANRVDLTFIDECVQAHLKAEHALHTNPGCRGRAFFISQGEPVDLWAWIDQVLRAHGMAPVRRAVSLKLALVLGGAGEMMGWMSGWRLRPSLTRFLAREMATDHYFDIAAAKRELGYQPRHTMAEAFAKTFGGAERYSSNPPRSLSQ